MEIFYLDKIEKLPLLEICKATIGNFDGVHLGHQDLIKRTKEKGFKSLVITFDDINKTPLFSLDEKIKKINEFDIDYLVVLKFEDFKMMFFNEFIKLLKKIRVKKIVIGRDFRFGFKKEGDYIDLDNNFELELVEDILIDNNRISSTNIKELLSIGNINDANKLLGYNYYVESTVMQGNQLGRTIGFPTANINEYNNILSTGVYYTNTTYKDNVYKSITNIGVNPTFNEQKNIKVETFILDFNETIYNEVIKVEFLKKLRDEKKFNSKEELIKTLTDDIKSII